MAKKGWVDPEFVTIVADTMMLMIKHGADVNARINGGANVVLDAMDVTMGLHIPAHRMDRLKQLFDDKKTEQWLVWPTISGLISLFWR